MLLTVDISPPEYSGKSLAFLDPVAMAEHGIGAGQIIKIQSCSGRSVLAKVAAPLSEHTDKGMIRLDRYIRQAIKVAPGEDVDIETVVAQPVGRVFLAPSIDISLPMEVVKSHLRNILSADSLPVCVGSSIVAVLPGAPGSTAFRVASVDPGPGIVTSDTEIEMIAHTSAGLDTTPQITYEDVGGLREEIKMVRELVELPLRFPQAYLHLGINPPRGIVFHGPPGVGKTHLALALANEVNAEVFYINGPEIVSTEFGETEAKLREIFHEAAHHTPSIILIDELDVIAPKRGETGSFTTTRTVSQLLTLLDGLRKVEGLIVIGTTNRIDSVDEAARRPGRFDREIFLSPPDITGRLQILHVHTRAMPVSQEAVSHLEEIAQRSLGFVGADLMELCREAGLNALRREFGDYMSYLECPESHFERIIVEKRDFESALGKIRPSAMREVLVRVSDIGWDDIGGLREAKERLRESLQMPLLHPEAFATMKIKPPSGILLYGPPGTGKNLLAKAIAGECQANFIPVAGIQIFSKWLGESEAQIRYIFQLARRVAPSIIFIDQIDGLAPRRGKDISTQATERVVSQLLAEIDSIQPTSRVAVVAATNRSDLIDPAVLQRFGTHILIPLPDESGRKETLYIYLKGIPLGSKSSLGEVVDMLATSTEGFSGAELESLCHRAKILALRDSKFEKSVPLELEHFQKALIEVKESRIPLTN